MQEARTAAPLSHVSDAAPRDATANLLLAATRRFADARPPSRLESDQYREAFYACIHRLDTATRQSVATLLSRTPYCPRPIALFLAMDVPAVSHSMIKHSRVLGERDLEQIIVKTTPIHVRLLAMRADLSTALIEMIAAFDDADIHAALLSNDTLTLDPALRTRIAPEERGPLRRTVVASTQAHGVPARTVEERLRTALQRTAPGRANAVTKAAPARVPNIGEFRSILETAAMKRDRKGMVEAMRMQFGLTHATAVQALDDRTGDALQVMMKASGFDAAAANRVVMLAIPAVGLSPAATERALEIWERLKVETCEAAFAAWPRDAARSDHAHAVYQPVHADAEGVRHDTRLTTLRTTAERLRETG